MSNVTSTTETLRATAAKAPVPIPVPQVVKELPVNKNADTNDWDTVFAIRFNDANVAISNSWAKIDDKAKNVSQSAADDPSYNLTGVLGPWQLTIGGDGKNIRMSCPFISGNYKAGASKNYDIKGYEVIIEVGMEWVPNPDQFAFSIGDNTKIDPIRDSLNNSTLSDSLKAEFTSHGKTLSAAANVILIKTDKDWVITDGKDNYYIFFYKDKYKSEFLQVYQFEDSWKNNLKILENAVNADEPAVVVVTIKNNKTEGIAAAVLPELISEWFNTNIGEFNHVFSSLDLSPGLSTSDKYKWIKPTGTSYAVTDNGTLDNSVFGVLTMTQGNSAPASHQVSPNAIPDRDGANAGFLISGTAFMKNMMLGSAQLIFTNEPGTSFDISNDGLTVTNNKELTWGRFKKDDTVVTTVSSSNITDLDKNTLSAALVAELKGRFIPTGDRGEGYYEPGIMVAGYAAHVSAAGSNWYLESPDSKTQYLLELDTKDTTKINLYNPMIFTIKKQQFKMSLVNSYLQIQFIDLLYPESWEYDVHINYTENVALGLKSLGGKQIFWFDKLTKDMTINVTKTTKSITVSIVEDAVLAVIGLIAVVAPLIDGIRAAVTIGEVVEDAGAAVISAEGFVEAIEDVPIVEQQLNEADGLINGLEQARGGWPAFKNAFTATRWKILGGIAGLIGAGVATQAGIEKAMEAMAKGEWEKVPGFDEFANDAIVPYSWPGVDGYDLKNAALASSLQVGLKTKAKQ